MQYILKYGAGMTGMIFLLYIMFWSLSRTPLDRSFLFIGLGSLFLIIIFFTIATDIFEEEKEPKVKAKGRNPDGEEWK